MHGQHLVVRIDCCCCRSHLAVYLQRLGGEEQLILLQNPEEESDQTDLRNYPWLLPPASV